MAAFVAHPIATLHPNSAFVVRCAPFRRPRFAFRCRVACVAQQHDLAQDDSPDLLANTRTVSVKLPLDAYLEETPAGIVYIDEIVAGGNADKQRVLKEGDNILAVSLPFGDGLMPVPTVGALDMVESFILERGEDERDFKMAVASGSRLNQIRAQESSFNFCNLPEEQLLDRAEQFYIAEYPIVPPDEQDETIDVEALRAYGFDM